MQKAVFILIFLILAQAQAAFDINALVNLAQQTKTVEEAVAKLPREYLQNYALVYESNSLQRATPMQPRVVLYGSGQSGLVFTYSTIKYGGGTSQSFEVAQFNSSARTFDYYEITYPAVDQPPGRPVVTKNPSMCYGCHRQDLRPNWSKFDRWGGVYGSEFGLPENSVEKIGFQKFVAERMNNPRYAPLLDLEKYYEKKPAAALQVIIAAQNSQRIARIVTGLKNYRPFKYALAGAADNAGDIESYIPDAMKQGHKPYSVVLGETAQQMEQFHLFSVKRQQALLNIQISDDQIRANPRLFPNWDMHRRFDVISKFNAGYTTDRYLEKIAKLRYVVENFMGESIEAWGVGVNANNLSFGTIGWNLDSFGRVPDFSQYILAADPEITGILKSTNGQDVSKPDGTMEKNSERIEALRTRSLKALSGGIRTRR